MAWALWDWADAAFNAVITTFVFSVYLTESVAADPDTGSTWLGVSQAIAGVTIAILAPYSGQRADIGGRRKQWLGIHSAVVFFCMLAMFFVRPDPSFLMLGVVLIALGSVFSEFAGVNYNAILLDISTPKNIGKISGFGWGMGYAGGVILLLIVYFALIVNDGGMLGITTEGGLNIRVVAVTAAVWFAIFAVPVLLTAPPPRARPATPKLNIVDSYRKIIRDVVALFRISRHTVYYLLASAVYRDGLSAIFSFGGVIAAGTFGLSAGDIIIFAVGANFIAAAGAMLAGRLDDRAGPKVVIVGSLVCLLIVGVVLSLSSGPTAFWIGGLLLALFVGPAQSASRTFLGRLTPPGKEGELFGLYAMTGRAASFLGPAAFAGFSFAFGAQRWGMVGILCVLLVGLLLLLPVRKPNNGSAVKLDEEPV